MFLKSKGSSLFKLIHVHKLGLLSNLANINKLIPQNHPRTRTSNLQSHLIPMEGLPSLWLGFPFRKECRPFLVCSKITAIVAIGNFVTGLLEFCYI